MRLTRIIIFLSFLSLASRFSFCGDETEIYLTNGDRLSGTIIRENLSEVAISSSLFGELTLRREVIAKIITPEDKTRQAEKEKAEKEKWRRLISAGYTASSGNTKKSALAMSVSADKAREVDEINLKGNLFYSTSENKMDAQNWYTMGKYAYNLFNRKLYVFGKCEVDHDRFANIDYRVLPSGGIGYRFFNNDDFKLLAEFGGGYSHTHYRDETPDRNEGVLTPRLFTEKKLFWDIVISEDLTFYPSMSSEDGYRLHSETALSAPIRNGLSVRVSAIDDYNSNPAEDAKSNDLKLISGLEYAF